MSGHSKWVTTKHKKVANDAECDELFAHLIKDAEVAARMDGDDPVGNPTLFGATQKAKRNSVPADNIDYMVRRGSGGGVDAVSYGSIIYESYASGGVAVLIECLTDNRGHATSEVCVVLTRNSGQPADPGSVAYMFTRKGIVKVPPEDVGEDNILTAVLEVGVEEAEDEGESFSIHCESGDVVAVRSALQDAGIEYNSTEAQFIPSVKVKVDAEGTREVFEVIDTPEDYDDVQNVFPSPDVPEAVTAELEAED